VSAPSNPQAEVPSSQRAITRRLITLAWPIIGVNVLQVLALAVDTAMIGRTVHAEAGLTGMGYGSQLIFLLMVGMIGLTVGTVAFVARAHGAGHHERVNHILHQSTQLTLALGLFIAVFGNLVARPLLWLLGADGPTMEAGLLYLRPLLLGSAFFYVNLLYAAVLRGVGNTRLAFYVALFMNGLNLVFNYGLILGNYGLPELGVQGAAIGTVVAQFCAAVLMYLLLHRDAVPGVRPNFVLKPVDRPLARDLIRIGWPAGADMIVLNAGFLTIVGLLARVDEVAVAAHTIGLRVQALAFVPGMSVSQATAAMVGMALGAGHVIEARQVVRASLVLCTGIMSLLGLLFIAWAGPIVQIFNVNPGSDLFVHAVMWMKILGYCMPVVGIYISFAGMLSGAGATRTTLRINSWVTFLVQIPASWVLGFPLGLGIFGIWVAFPTSFAIKAVWGWIEYRRGHWAKVGARA
jgi:putative MATE family efflux protein